jgi:MinD superfamily P-loop ATPase
MIIAIASGKGGTGKTTLAVNLAGLLSESAGVVLVDLDVEEPNSGLFLRGEPRHREDKFKMVPEWKEDHCTLCGLCQRVCNFHSVLKLGKEIMVFPELCHGCYACSELCPAGALPMVPVKMGELAEYNLGKLSFVESRLDIGEEQAVPLIAQTLAYVNGKFPEAPLVLLDCPPGTSCPVIEATKNADFVILVTEPTPFGLHDLSLAVLTMRELTKEIGVVVNRFGIGNDEVVRYCEKENIPILARIPNDRHIAELYSRGAMIYTEVPEFRRELEKIALFIKAVSERSRG